MNHEVFDQLVNELVGVPFKHKGMDRNGVDCSFLLVLFLNDYYERVGSNFRIVLPSEIVKNYDRHFFLRHNSKGRSIIKELCDGFPNMEEKTDWQMIGVKAIEKGDILIFPRGNCPGGHGGLCYKDGNPPKYINSLFKGGVKRHSLNQEKPRFVYRVDYEYGLT